MNHQFLEWDSAFFGFPIARILAPTLSAENLEAYLDELFRQGARLVYWSSNEKLPADVAERLDAVLADRKLHFGIDLRVWPGPDPAHLERIEPFGPDVEPVALYPMALECGRLSRFRIDPRMPADRVTEMYRTWLDRSVSGALADQVYLARVGVDVAGMVTVAGGDVGARLDMIAVSCRYRRRRYGQRLVASALNWAFKSGHRYCSVTTQQRNVATRNLLQNCGFSLQNLRYFYHFWR